MNTQHIAKMSEHMADVTKYIGLAKEEMDDLNEGHFGCPIFVRVIYEKALKFLCKRT